MSLKRNKNCYRFKNPLHDFFIIVILPKMAKNCFSLSLEKCIALVEGGSTTLRADSDDPLKSIQFSGNPDF